MKYFTLRSSRIAAQDGLLVQNGKQFSSSQDNLQHCHFGGNNISQGQQHVMYFCKPAKKRPKLPEVSSSGSSSNWHLQHQHDVKAVAKTYQIHHRSTNIDQINRMDPFLLMADDVTSSPCPKSAPLPRKKYPGDQRQQGPTSKKSKVFSPLQKLLHRQKGIKSSRSIEELENDNNLSRSIEAIQARRRGGGESVAVLKSPVVHHHHSVQNIFTSASLGQQQPGNANSHSDELAQFGTINNG